MTSRFYIESDGRIYLVSRNGMLDLPERQEIPFEIDQVAALACSTEVAYCVPQLDKHPAKWMSKDAVSTADNVVPLVREAVHATMPRVVSEGVYIRDGQVLLLKGSRGLTKDRWTLPGGFVRFGEGPEEGLIREIAEELGARAEIVELLAVRSKLGQHTRLHWTQFFYRVEIFGDLNPDPDEIADAEFVSPREGARLLADPLMQEVIGSLAQA